LEGIIKNGLDPGSLINYPARKPWRRTKKPNITKPSKTILV
jgi:hypothetical protein